MAVAEIVIAALVWGRPQPQRLALGSAVAGLLFSCGVYAPAGLGFGLVAVGTSLSSARMGMDVLASAGARRASIAALVVGIAAIMISTAFMLLIFAIGSSDITFL